LAKAKSQFICQACGTLHPRWAGRCEGCGDWNSIVEELNESAPIGGKSTVSKAKGRRVEFVPLTGESAQAPRLKTGIAEFDRVTGGGLVKGSAILIGGDPGIGKSTLLLQVTAAIAKKTKCAYISGEEAVDQIRMRASRLGVTGAPVELATATNIRNITATLEDKDGPDVVVIDSIQTMFVDGLESAPGSVGQVRASAQELIRCAKKHGVCVLLVGHVTKEGNIAGPRILEHMVDTVLYFEGERGHQFRILRGVKNRFGATDEIGVFDMTEKGLVEVPNPSALFLADRKDGISGAVVFAGMEGSRPLLVEIQALVAPSPLATPRRAVIGWDSNRLAMIMAVLEARAGFSISGNDVYLNVAGGIRLSEPAADLAVAAALVSSLTDTPVASDMVVFGEIGLSGEVRSVSQMEARLKEAGKLGFNASLMPKRHNKSKTDTKAIRRMEISTLDGLDVLLADGENNTIRQT